MKLYKPKDLLNFLSIHNIKPKKTLSQNFLVDKNILDKIIKTSNYSNDDIVLEIGPGPGVITLEIIKKAKKVIAVEKDNNFAKNLKVLKIDNLEMQNIDFLKYDLDLLKKYNKKIKVISAIPYHLSSPIITKLLKNNFLFSSIVLIIQKELAEKLISLPNTKSYGFLSVFVNFIADIKIIKNISKNCFFPKPKVDSCLIELKIKDSFLDAIKKEIEIENFFYFVKTAFLQRRKKLISSIKTFSSKEKILKALNELNINKDVRCENLSLDNFLALFKKLFKK